METVEDDEAGCRFAMEPTIVRVTFGFDDHGSARAECLPDAGGDAFCACIVEPLRRVPPRPDLAGETLSEPLAIGRWTPWNELLWRTRPYLPGSVRRER